MLLASNTRRSVDRLNDSSAGMGGGGIGGAGGASGAGPLPSVDDTDSERIWAFSSGNASLWVCDEIDETATGCVAGNGLTNRRNDGVAGTVHELKDGRFYLDAKELTLEQMRARVREEYAKDKETRAVIAADGRVSHSHVVQVIDLLRQEKVTKFAINVRPEDLAGSHQ